jgi:hypothetical protein
MELVPQKQQVEVERRNSCSAVDHLESVVLSAEEGREERNCSEFRSNGTVA